MTKPIDRLIVALDFPSTVEAKALTDKLGDTVSIYKIGLELLFNGGMDLAKQLILENKRIFIDAKLLDIGNTVERAVANIARTGAEFLTIHGLDRKTMEAAIRGRGTSNLKLLAVTVMTNLESYDLDEQGITRSPEDLVLHRAKLAADCGIDGVVASGHEAAQIRAAVGPSIAIVTPGIRPTGTPAQDQTRVMTPDRAIAAGADYLVVGRPITQAGDPEIAAKSIINDINTACQN